VDHLSWLFSQGYAEASALKLVGDRFGLTERQRRAVLRCSCSDEALTARSERMVPIDQLRGEAVAIDGFNVLTTIEAALAGGVVLAGRDGCWRDMASMHGSYRKVAETRPALELIGACLAARGVTECRWLLDRPVSNSARLRTIMQELAAERGWRWTVELAADPDRELSVSPDIVATADSVILDRCARWCNLAREVLRERVPEANVVRLSGFRSQESGLVSRSSLTPDS
jgi:hypothetical protein